MKTSTRFLAERLVASHNIVLRDTVKSMDTIALLRNMHPAYAEQYAMEFYKEGAIEKEQTYEFIQKRSDPWI